MIDANASVPFTQRNSVKQIEEGLELAPKFNNDGLIAVVTTDYDSGEVLMLGYMNAEALLKTIETGEAYYWSRSRKVLWHKGATSGFIQKVRKILVDDDQDAIWLKVDVGGKASCHVGYRSCFYRAVLTEQPHRIKLERIDKEKMFDPEEVYKEQANPTRL